MPVQIKTTTTIHFGDLTWKPDVLRVQSLTCIRLKPTSRALVKIVLAHAGYDPHTFCTKSRPSLYHVSGLLALKALRNTAQAESLQEPTDSGQGSKRRLFQCTPKTKPKKPRVSRDKLNELRASPSVIHVDDGDVKLAFQRPVKNTDDIVIPLDATCIDNTLDFIVKNGVYLHEFTHTRPYRMSGRKFVRTFGKYVYRAGAEGSLTRLEPSGSEDDALEADAGDNGGERSDGHVELELDVDGLPSASDSD